MVMLDMEMLMAVKNCRNFQTQSHRLYNDLNYSTLADAEQDLLHHLTNVRLKKLSLKEFKQIWQNTGKYDGKTKNRQWIEYNITYSRQDLIKKHQKAKNKKHETLESLKFNYCPTYSVDDNEQTNESPLEKEKQLVLANLNLLFQRSPKKREYIQYVLDVDNQESEFQFSPSMNEQLMLRSISQYCDQHRKDFDKVLNRELSNKDRKTLSFINIFLMVEDNADTIFQAQGKQAEIINQSKANKALFEDLVGLCGSGKSHYITHQKALLEHWEKVEYQTEKNYLVDYLRLKKEELEKKLK